MILETIAIRAKWGDKEIGAGQGNAPPRVV